MKKTIAGLALLLISPPAVFAQSAIEPQRKPLIELDVIANKKAAPVITGVAIQPNGKLIATAGDDHLVRLWNSEDGELSHVLKGHRDWVRSVSFSSDGHTVASVGDDHQAIIWNASTGRAIITLPPTPYALFSVAFNPMGTQLASVGFNNTVLVHSAIEGKLLHTIATDCDELRSVMFSPDGTQIVVAGRNKIQVCDVATDKVVNKMRSSLKRVRGAVYSPDGSTIAAAGEGAAIELWNPATGESIAKISSQPAKIHAIVFCADNKIATGGTDNSVRIWDTKAHTQLHQFKGHHGSVATLACDIATGTIVSGGFDTSIRVWNVAAVPEATTATKPKSTQPVR